MLSSWTKAVKSNFTPKGLKLMLTVGKPVEPETTGKGNSPPARKVAFWPLTAIRFGSARISSTSRACRAWIATPKLISLRNRKRFKGLVILRVGGVAVTEVAVVFPTVVVVAELVWMEVPPNCPVLRVPVV